MSYTYNFSVIYVILYSKFIQKILTSLKFPCLGNLTCEKIYQQLKKKNIWMDSYEEIHELVSVVSDIKLLYFRTLAMGLLKHDFLVYRNW